MTPSLARSTRFKEIANYRLVGTESEKYNQCAVFHQEFSDGERLIGVYTPIERDKNTYQVLVPLGNLRKGLWTLIRRIWVG